MKTNEILAKTKTELKAIVESVPFHFQPRWKNKATKDELAGWLISLSKLEEGKKILSSLPKGC